MTGFFLWLIGKITNSRLVYRVTQPFVWLRAGRFYVRQHQSNLKYLTVLLKEQLKEDVRYTFSAKEKCAVIYSNVRIIATISVLRNRDLPKVRRVLVKTDLHGGYLCWFQLAFLGMKVKFETKKTVLLLM